MEPVTARIMEYVFRLTVLTVPAVESVLRWGVLLLMAEIYMYVEAGCMSSEAVTI